MTSRELLLESFSRIGGLVDKAVDGMTPDQLCWRPAESANSIAWLVWHLTRIQDDHVAAAFKTEQIWTSKGWCETFALPFEPTATGYGQSSEEVARICGATPDQLAGYYRDTEQQTIACLRDVTDTELDQVVDSRWNPPVTLAVRLVSVLADDLQHCGQAAYVRGLLEAIR